MDIKKVLVAVIGVFSIVIFGLVFFRQLQVNQNELANMIADDPINNPEVAGSSVINFRAGSDALLQLEKDVDSVNFSAIEKEAKQIDAQIQNLK